MMLCTIALWFFAVSVFEPVDKADAVMTRYAGGWTHDGPYATERECNIGRVRVEADPAKHGLKRRQKPAECFRRTYEEYIMDMTRVRR